MERDASQWYLNVEFLTNFTLFRCLNGNRLKQQLDSVFEIINALKNTQRTKSNEQKNII